MKESVEGSLKVFELSSKNSQLQRNYLMDSFVKARIQVLNDVGLFNTFGKKSLKVFLSSIRGEEEN